MTKTTILNDVKSKKDPSSACNKTPLGYFITQQKLDIGTDIMNLESAIDSRHTVCVSTSTDV